MGKNNLRWEERSEELLPLLDRQLGTNKKGQDSILGEGKILYLDLVLGYIGACLCPKLQHFIVHKVHFKKANCKQVLNSSQYVHDGAIYVRMTGTHVSNLL